MDKRHHDIELLCIVAHSGHMHTFAIVAPFRSKRLGEVVHAYALLPSFIKHPILCQIRHPAPKWCRGESNAIVVITVNLLDKHAAQALCSSVSSIQ